MTDPTTVELSDEELLNRLVEWAADGVDYLEDSPWGEITTDCARAVDRLRRLSSQLQASQEREQRLREWCESPITTNGPERLGMKKAKRAILQFLNPEEPAPEENP